MVSEISQILQKYSEILIGLTVLVSLRHGKSGKGAKVSGGNIQGAGLLNDERLVILYIFLDHETRVFMKSGIGFVQQHLTMQTIVKLRHI